MSPLSLLEVSMGRTGRTLYLGLMTAGLFALTGSLGCQEETTSTTGGKAGSAGDGGSGAGGNTGGTGTAGSNTGGTGATGGSTGGTGTGGMIDPCEDGSVEKTVYQVTDKNAAGAVGQDVKVRLNGVIAMSRKRLASYSTTSGNCLWGVFVSAPQTADGNQLTETAAHSGVVVLSIGEAAPSAAECKNNTDAIPPDVAPGDVLDVIGQTSVFPLPQFEKCGNDPDFPNDTTVPQIQIYQACRAAKTGTAAIPAAHVLTAAEITALSKQKEADGAAETHAAWGNVWVQVKDAPIQTWQQGNIVGPFGKVLVGPNSYEVGDSYYYKQGSAEVCEVAPKFDDLNPKPTTWGRIDGFHVRTFCTWGLQPVDKCAAFSPVSPDCAAANITTCLP
ncbi:MAG: hypothetical protein IPK82_37800 [Polyangiaceae bacterium]|nr:hypothetical protein [Polyangiaceae bacterium]